LNSVPLLSVLLEFFCRNRSYFERNSVERSQNFSFKTDQANIFQLHPIVLDDDDDDDDDGHRLVVSLVKYVPCAEKLPNIRI